MRDPPNPCQDSLQAGQYLKSLSDTPIANYLGLHDVFGAPLHWIIVALSPWRGAKHPNPPKKEHKSVASLIAKHELMYPEKIRDVVEDVFEKDKVQMVRDASAQNELQPLSRRDSGMTPRSKSYKVSDFGSEAGFRLADYHICCDAF